MGTCENCGQEVLERVTCAWCLRLICLACVSADDDFTVCIPCYNRTLETIKDACEGGY